MSNPILINDNLVDITAEITSPQWITVDLSAYLNHDDPKMVIIIIENTAGASRNVGCKPVGSAIADLYAIISLTSPDVMQFPCSLAGGSTIQLFSPNIGTSGLKYYIHAEVGGDDAIIYDDPIFIQRASPVGWGTVDSTTRLGADAGKVSSVFLFIHWIAAGVYAYRSFGSVDAYLAANTAESNTFGICGIDTRDRYQTYQSITGGKTPQWRSFFWEVGFMRRNWNHIENPVDRNLVVGGAWTDEDLTDITEDAARIALIRYWNSGPALARHGWFRNDGGSQSPLVIQQTTTRHALVNLTDQQIYEYYITDSNVHQAILGWYAAPTNIICVDSGEINIDTGTINLG